MLAWLARLTPFYRLGFYIGSNPDLTDDDLALMTAAFDAYFAGTGVSPRAVAGARGPR